MYLHACICSIPRQILIKGIHLWLYTAYISEHIKSAIFIYLLFRFFTTQAFIRGFDYLFVYFIDICPYFVIFIRIKYAVVLVIYTTMHHPHTEICSLIYQRSLVFIRTYFYKNLGGVFTFPCFLYAFTCIYKNRIKPQVNTLIYYTLRIIQI